VSGIKDALDEHIREIQISVSCRNPGLETQPDRVLRDAALVVLFVQEERITFKLKTAEADDAN
jgi:hypothetical protein